MSEIKREKNETGIRHRFKQFIDERGISQKALAKEMEVTPSYISAICLGRKQISGDLMKNMILKGHGNDLLWIISGVHPEEEVKQLKDDLDRANDLIDSLERIMAKKFS